MKPIFCLKLTNMGKFSIRVLHLFNLPSICDLFILFMCALSVSIIKQKLTYLHNALLFYFLKCVFLVPLTHFEIFFKVSRLSPTIMHFEFFFQSAYNFFSTILLKNANILINMATVISGLIASLQFCWAIFMNIDLDVLFSHFGFRFTHL